MKPTVRLMLFIVPCAFALLAYLIGPTNIEITWRKYFVGAPSLDCPKEVTLGELEMGARAVVKFRLSNRGRNLLEIEEVPTTCACNSLELDYDGPTQRLKSITLAPGASVDVRSSFLVRGRPGHPTEAEYVLKTNDPWEPLHKVVVKIARVNGGTTCLPTSFIAGRVAPASGKLCYVDLFDGGNKGRKIERVESTRPRLFTARFISADGEQECENGICRLGRIEVRIVAEDAGSFEGSVLVFLADEKRVPDEIPVFCTVVRPIEAIPPQIVLPMRTGSEWSNEMTCLVQQTEGLPFDLRVAELPVGWTVNIENRDTNSSTKRLRVSFSRNHTKQNPEFDTRIRLTAKLGEEQHQVSIPVIYLPRNP